MLLFSEVFIVQIVQFKLLLASPVVDEREGTRNGRWGEEEGGGGKVGKLRKDLENSSKINVITF